MNKKKPAIPAEDTGAKNRGLLKLYVAGNLAISTRAINNLQAILENHFKGKFSLEVIDIYQQPILASQNDITAVPMLVRHSPLPKRIMVGDMSDVNRVVSSLTS